MAIAILDFGTNTFNLLIAERSGKSFKRIYSGKQPVKLGRGGIHKRTLTDEAMDRGYLAIERHMDTISSFNVEEIHAYATSAIRNADNGADFVSGVQRRFGFTTHVISGEREAELIYRGISASINFNEHRGMILDIGGGSNELIICDSRQMFWKHSFELGMARIVEQFPISDPIKPEEIRAIESFYASELQLLFEKAGELKPVSLIGASGSFDTLAAMLRHKKGLDNGASSLQISLSEYREIHQVLINSTLKEREIMPGMEPVRLEMIVPATIFINFVIERCGLQSIYQSDHALKEGVMMTIIES